MKLKVIRQNGKILLIRLSFNLKVGSIKVHLIMRDDIESPHNHPWDFKSFLITPYKEELYYQSDKTLIGTICHRRFTTLKRNKDIVHKTVLYKWKGIPIPALTIGRYSEKKQLCSFCKEAGYCKQS